MFTLSLLYLCSFYSQIHSQHKGTSINTTSTAEGDPRQ